MHFLSILGCIKSSYKMIRSPLSSVDYDAIVVGLGISGTSAAATLAKAGKRVLALEAQDRVGGRVHTHLFGGGIVELGAEWIHGTVDSPTYDLAVQNNVSLISDDLELQAYNSNGTVDSGVVTELMTYAMGLMDDLQAEPEPLGQFITRRIKAYLQSNYPALLEDADFMENFLSFLDQIFNNYEASNSWNDVSTAMQYQTLDGDQHMSWHKHGYHTLFDIILNTYNNGPGLPNLTTKLNTEVVNVKWPRDTAGLVEVTTKDGTVYKAEAVIVTVSLGVLKGTHEALFTPPLPASKAEAIKVMSMGVMDKVDLLFQDAWWTPHPHTNGFLWRNQEKRQLPKGDEWLTKIWGATAPVGHDKVLTLWTSGETAKLVETLPAEEVKTKLTGLLRLFMGPNVPEPLEMVRSTWFSNPFTRGSYSYDSVDAANHPSARIDLAEPLVDATQRVRVLFAGEATHPNRFSTVHGALATGNREAERLLQTSSKL